MFLFKNIFTLFLVISSLSTFVLLFFSPFKTTAAAIVSHRLPNLETTHTAKDHNVQSMVSQGYYQFPVIISNGFFTLTPVSAYFLDQQRYNKYSIELVGILTLGILDEKKVCQTTLKNFANTQCPNFLISSFSKQNLTNSNNNSKFTTFYC